MKPPTTPTPRETKARRTSCHRLASDERKSGVAVSLLSTLPPELRPEALYYIEMHGDDNLLWASDYPHPDASYPDASSQFLALDSISSETKKKVLWDNPITYYGFQPALSLP